MAGEKEMACCVRGYHEYKDIKAAATRKVLVCGRLRTVIGKIFAVKLYSVRYFVCFLHTKIFLQRKKSELRYILHVPLLTIRHLYVMLCCCLMSYNIVL